MEEAEQRHAVHDERLGPEPVPFGFLHEQWRALLDGMEEGDALWEFRSPREMWENMMGREGIALVRDGTIIQCMITVMN